LTTTAAFIGFATLENEYSLNNYGLPVTKVVIWGVKLHSHTHSYIHWAFDRAFRNLGYTVYWLDNSDDIRALDLSHALFLTVGLADQNIPLREDGWYILHQYCGQFLKS
jgi:hypothetical protein